MLGLVLCWALLGKVIPSLFPEGSLDPQKLRLVTRVNGQLHGGLAVTEVGGDLIEVEATWMPGRSANDQHALQQTGQLGEVMQESVQAAYSYVRAHSREFGATPDFFERHSLHVHVPAGAVPKDGPSAGVTMVTAIVSALSGRPV